MSQAPAAQAPAGTPPGTPRPATPEVPPVAGGTPPATPPTPPATPPAGEGTPAEPAAPAPAEPLKIDMSVMEQIGGMVKEAGLDPAQVAKIMTEDGMTPAIYKALSDKHGEGVASLIKSQLETANVASKETAKAQDQVIYDLVAEQFKDVTEQTGADTWKELSTWAKTNVEPADRAEINKLLNQGGMAAKLAVQELITVFKASSGYQQDASLVSADGVSDLGTGKPLSKQEYNTQLNKLMQAGHVYGESNEIAQLDNRRLKSIKRGR